MKRTRPYDAPRIVVLGPVATLTQVVCKKFHTSDGLTFMARSIGNSSV